jgi:hypothetical protein
VPKRTTRTGLGSRGSAISGPPSTVELSSGGAVRQNEHTFVARIELAGLSDEAKLLCGKYIEKFAVDLANEATLVEEIGRATDAKKPEITATMLSMAHKAVMQRQATTASYSARGSKKTYRSIQIVAALSTAGAGVCAAYLHAKWQVALFTVLAVLAVLSTSYSIWRQG